MEAAAEFPLAVFLILNAPHAYFSYQQGVDAHPKTGRGAIWNTREFSLPMRPVGKALGPAVKEGYVYTRSYEKVDVWVDVEKGEAKLTWKGND